MEALPLCILILLFVWTVKSQVILENGCIKYKADATITCALPQGTTITNANILWYFGPDEKNIVSIGQVLSNNPKYDVATSGNTFSLVIHELLMDDIGIYKCTYLPTTEFEYNLEKADIEDITCNATGGINEATITVQYNNKVLQKPEAAAVKSGGTPVDATCVYVSSAGELTDGTCTFENLDPGTYSYTVTNHGICDLKCTDQVIVNGVPTTTAAPTTTAPTTTAPTTIAPTIAAPTTTAPTTTAPATAAPTTAAPTTTDATTSKPTDNFQIIYAVVGSLCGIIIIFAVVVILIYKNRKHKRSVEKKQSRPKQRNQLNGRGSHQYDNRAFIGSAHGHMYNTGRPYPSHVPSHSYSMSPVYQQQDRNDRNHLQGHKPGLYFSGGSNRERPLNVKYYTGQSQRY